MFLQLQHVKQLRNLLPILINARPIVTATRQTVLETAVTNVKKSAVRIAQENAVTTVARKTAQVTAVMNVQKSAAKIAQENAVTTVLKTA